MMPTTGNPTYGTLHKTDDGSSQLRFTRSLSHPIERVWAAVTEADHLSQWFPTTIEGTFEVGGALRFSFPPPHKIDPIEGRMLAYEPPHVIEFEWGADVIRIELQEHQGGTELTLLDTLDEAGKAARDGAGWHTCLDALEASLADADDRGGLLQSDRWSQVHPHYVESFGPEASTLGPPEGYNG